MATTKQRTLWINYDSLRMHCLVSLNSTGKRITYVGYNACLKTHIRQSYTDTATENKAHRWNRKSVGARPPQLSADGRHRLPAMNKLLFFTFITFLYFTLHHYSWTSQQVVHTFDRGIYNICKTHFNWLLLTKTSETENRDCLLLQIPKSKLKRGTIDFCLPLHHILFTALIDFIDPLLSADSADKLAAYR